MQSSDSFKERESGEDIQVRIKASKLENCVIGEGVGLGSKVSIGDEKQK